MFIWRLQDIMAEFQRQMPELYAVSWKSWLHVLVPLIIRPVLAGCGMAWQNRLWIMALWRAQNGLP